MKGEYAGAPGLIRPSAPHSSIRLKGRSRAVGRQRQLGAKILDNPA
jgi:hypothetical protein